MTDDERYQLLGTLVATAPDFSNIEGKTTPPEMATWLARGFALIEPLVDLSDQTSYRNAWNILHSRIGSRSPETIMAVLYRALAKAELKATSALRGAFINAGSAFDALAMIAKVLNEAKSDLLFIDPYMDEKTLTTYAILAPEGIAVRLLADSAYVKPSLAPASVAWRQQYLDTRPLEIGLAAPKTLHDRLIIVDGKSAWSLTQSLNAFATRAPASILRADADTTALKLEAYQAIWAAAPRN